MEKTIVKGESINVRLYLEQDQARHHEKTFLVPGTNYQLVLTVNGQLQPTPQGRVTGQIVGQIAKIDQLDAGGGDFIEPVIGRPRRVLGTVREHLVDRRAVVVEAAGLALVCLLPEQGAFDQLAINSKVGLALSPNTTFEPVNLSA